MNVEKKKLFKKVLTKNLPLTPTGSVKGRGEVSPSMIVYAKIRR